METRIALLTRNAISGPHLTEDLHNAQDSPIFPQPWRQILENEWQVVVRIWRCRRGSCQWLLSNARPSCPVATHLWKFDIWPSTRRDRLQAGILEPLGFGCWVRLGRISWFTGTTLQRFSFSRHPHSESTRNPDGVRARVRSSCTGCPTDTASSNEGSWATVCYFLAPDESESQALSDPGIQGPYSCCENAWKHH